MRFPKLRSGDGIRKSVLVEFGGLNHTAAASDGELWDMENLWSGDAPLLSVRPPRWSLSALTRPHGIFAVGPVLFSVDGTTLYADGQAVAWADGAPGASRPTNQDGSAQLSDTDKVFAALGERLLIWPDKVMARKTSQASEVTAPLSEELESNPSSTAEWELVPLEHSATVIAAFTDGTYAGESAEANTIQASVTQTGHTDGFDWSDYFSVGDGVTISGASDEENNKTIIIREIETDENYSYLRFYENSFTDSAAAEITVTREVPELDFLCVNENRVWGCKEDTIRCSKLGDPFNWNVFDGISTDAWSWDTGTAGDFTAAYTFMGYACFFKERQIFKIYGNRPSNFEAMSAPDLGVMAGSGRSLAVANEVLYYLSRAGVMAYSGGIPTPIGLPLGGTFQNAVGGSDGLRYYVSMGDAEGNVRLYVHDALRGLWHIEDDAEAMTFASLDAGSVLCLETDGTLWSTGAMEGATKEQSIAWAAEFADYTMGSPDKKGVSKLQIRLEMEEESSVTVQVQYDSDGVWHTAAMLTATVKRSWYLPVIPRRCDHFRLRLSGTGACRLYSLATELYIGSALQRH